MFVFRWLTRDCFWAGQGLEASVIRSEIRSTAEFNRALPLSLHRHTNEIPRTDPLVQVGYVRVVDLDIGASKSGFGEGRAVADLDDFNGSAQITNLGGRSSNLFGRAIFPPFSTKPRTIAEFPYGSVPI